MLDIQPQYLSLAKLLDRRLFHIPEYQRAYSWSSRQRRDLFEDIMRVHSKGTHASHFMAAVVALRRKKIRIGTDEFQNLEIVDGQQRITTLIILLNAIRLSLKDERVAEAKLAVELTELLVKQDGARLLLLQTNHDTSNYFSAYIRNGEISPPENAKTVADHQLLKAIQDCHDFIDGWLESGKKLTTLVSLLKNRIFFLIHELGEEKVVYTVFEVLNSRGLEVSWFDRLKSILMGAAFELRGTDNRQLIKELHSTWCDIYSIVGRRQGLSTEALRFAATLWVEEAPSRPLGEQDSVEVFRAEAQSAKQILAVAKWIRDVSKACDKVSSDTRTSAVTRISQARLLAVALHLSKRINAASRDKLLVSWEKVSFKLYGMLAKDARFRVGDYVRLAWKVVNLNPKELDIRNEIIQIGAEFSVEEAVENLRQSNCYEGWESELRYFFFRYEEYLAASDNLNFSNEQWGKIWMESPSKSIEHIWPQSKAPEDAKHALGNLMLLPPNLNSKLKDQKPKEKLSSYRKTGLLLAEDVCHVLESKRWTKKAVKEREEKLLAWAKREWRD